MKIKLIFLVLLLIILPGFGLKCVSEEVENAMQPITLEYWRVWDEKSDFDGIITAYKALHPYITINYRKLRYSEYEKELLNAFAEDRAPDIFSIHNTWTRKYQNKIEPMPAKITMAYPIVKGSLKKEVIPELRTSKSITLKEIKNNFINAVYDDVVVDDKVYSLPLSVDTLSLYYNRDLFDNAGITKAPEYWNKDFQQNIKALTKIDRNGTILQSGIALGGSKNIDRSVDILSILMIQNGAEMMQGGNIKFHSIPTIYLEQKFNPGLEALRFYTDFSNSSKEVYSWNNNLDNSVDMFAQGKLAMMLGYSYHKPTIEAKAPKLNFGITYLPQIEGSTQKINFANYWSEAVSKKSKHTDEAWDFIQFITKADQVKSYLKSAKKPTALRSLIEEQLEDPDVDVFADQVLTAQSWYKGIDPNAMEKIMLNMIDNAISEPENIDKIIRFSAEQVRQTIK